MSAESVKTEVASVDQVAEQKESNAERNFAKLRQKADKAEQMADQERNERLKLQEEVERLRGQRVTEFSDDEEDDSSDPYVDKRKLKKLFTKWEAKNDEKIVRTAQEIARQVLNEDRQRNFMTQLKSEHRDFDEVVNDDTIEKLKAGSPRMAAMLAGEPDEYKKHAIAYEAIKLANLHRKPENVKEKVEQNMKNPYYYPSSMGTGGTSLGDFSSTGKKAAYDKIQQLKASRRG